MKVEPRHEDEWNYANYAYLMFTLPLILKLPNIVETGLSKGHSTRIFAQVAQNLNGHLWTVDINDYPETRARLSELGLTSHWTFIQKDSVEAGKEWPAGTKIDLLFLDSDHHIDQVYRELEAWIPHTNPPAIIMTHDTSPVQIQNPDHLTFNAFERWHNTHPEFTIMNLSHPEGLGLMWRSEIDR